MGEPEELDNPLPSEDEPRRWTIGAGLICAGAAVIILGLAYFLVPRRVAAFPPSPPTIPVALLREPTPSKAGSHTVAPGARSARGVVPVALPPRDYRSAPSQPATFLDIVRRNNAKAYVGRLFRFDSINVVMAPLSGVLSVGLNPADSLMVRLDKATSRPGVASRIAPGDKLYLVGRLMPEPAEETMRRWGLSAEDVRRIGIHSVYIRAMVVQDAY